VRKRLRMEVPKERRYEATVVPFSHSGAERKGKAGGWKEWRSGGRRSQNL